MNVCLIGILPFPIHVGYYRIGGGTPTLEGGPTDPPFLALFCPVGSLFQSQIDPIDHLLSPGAISLSLSCLVPKDNLS